MTNLSAEAVTRLQRPWEAATSRNGCTLGTMNRILMRRGNTGLESPVNPQAGKPAPRRRFMESGDRNFLIDCIFKTSYLYFAR